MSKFNKLYTEHGWNLSGVPWQKYPRPQFKRDSFISLNGEWDFGVGMEEVYNRKINVPFCPESLLSGINEVFSEDMTLYYRREFKLPDSFNKGRVILHFGAVDQKCSVYLNGKNIGSHKGGYNAFSFDITEFLEEDNIITVFVTDTLSDKILPYGKQCKNRGGMWYTSVSGIWQSVWLESVPMTYIKGIKIDVTLNSADIMFDGVNDGTVRLEDKEIPIIDGKAHIEVEEPDNWTPENPHLYYFTAVSGEDKIESYFALRTLGIKENKLLLNEKPYFFHGILDQGYFSDGIFTPACEEAYTDDIMKMKALGFNMLRKHIKVEPECFYYDCDRLGMVVFQDMVNNSDYSFIRDTALPTISFVRKNDRNSHKNKESREAFINCMEKTVHQLYNHPCIVEWTIFNEGWGQFCADEMYMNLKQLDSSRFIDSASGWFKTVKNDFDSLHIYFKKLKAKEGNKPLFISEFGGYSYKIKGHSFNTENTYGYGKFTSRDKFVYAIRSLYENEVIPLKEKGLCATVYTQVSDVEDETNGLLTYDRKVMKIKPEEFKDISESLKIIY
ncbi:MAG: glycoside hydrolase family 2 TIM barrel-domain containing protein [Acutalibacteraceae bacterium]|nr:glycoside hydrolase family 2 TIM barrel-domain containing protein [Acutalibacteraceae bacterium]